ncbi:MAG: hypothetical protein KYX66_12445 [Blastomonas fulva]|uniref:hypothetical protein n=1 Tax=Blastomonas fulva TaxID=1550728 RepID=UPI0024E25A84|nr:hypothetical protein [Blastomonas fulva]MDK2757535.1 hypothetical protein [Blastomonas fulva]
MTIDRRFSDLLSAQSELRAMHEDLRRFIEHGGGSGSGPFDSRVSRLEDKMEKVVGELGDVKVNIATLTERIAHLPSKGFIVTTSATALALLTAIIVFADNIKALVAG